MSRGPGPPRGGERESLTSMCFSFVKHHTSPCDSHMCRRTLYYRACECRAIRKVGENTWKCVWGVRAFISVRNPERNFTALHTHMHSMRMYYALFLYKATQFLLFYIMRFSQLECTEMSPKRSLVKCVFFGYNMQNLYIWYPRLPTIGF